MLDDIPLTVFLCLYCKGTLCVNIDTSLIVSAFERWHVSFLARRDVIGNTTAICVRDDDTCEGDTGTEKEFLLVLDSTPNTKKLRTSRIEILLFRYDLDFVWACVIQCWICFEIRGSTGSCVTFKMLIVDSLVGTITQTLCIRLHCLRDAMRIIERLCLGFVVDRWPEKESSLNEKSTRCTDVDRRLLVAVA